jgi:thymidylate synthase
MGLRALQGHIRDEIAGRRQSAYYARSQYDLTMGLLITIGQSAHIYDDTWENVDKLIANQYERIMALLNQGMNDNLAPIQKLVWV